jgi:hypothetical protein
MRATETALGACPKENRDGRSAAGTLNGVLHEDSRRHRPQQRLNRLESLCESSLAARSEVLQLANRLTLLRGGCRELLLAIEFLAFGTRLAVGTREKLAFAGSDVTPTHDHSLESEK